MKVIVISLFSLLLMSCGATVDVDYEKETDWLHYKIYSFYPALDSGLNDLDDKRIMKAVDSLLLPPEYQKSDYNQFYINFYASEILANSRNTIGIGLGSGGGNVGVGVSGGIPIGGRVIQQQLTIDFIDSAKDELVWQAIIHSELKEKATPRQRDEHYFNLMQKALKKFPPKNK